MTDPRSKNRKKTIRVRKMKEEFSLSRASNYGGANLLLDFLRETHLLQELEKNISIRKAPGYSYSMSNHAFTYILGILLGLKRTSHHQLIEKDPVLTAKCHVDKFQDDKTTNKDLKRFRTERHISELKTVNTNSIKRSFPVLRDPILDFDSEVNTVYGNQEKAAIGYNPQKKGRKSYHPLAAFLAKQRLMVNYRLRGGEAASVTGAVPFMKSTIASLPRVRGTLFGRFDSGFDSEHVFRLWEIPGRRYAAKLKLRTALKHHIHDLKLPKTWTKYQCGDGREFEVGATRYHAKAWSRSRRVVVVRKRIAKPHEAFLFEDAAYEYQAIVTNRDDSPVEVYRFYNGRCGSENYIKEHQDGFAFEQFPTNAFHANYAAQVMKMIAYNCFQAFKRKLMPRSRWSDTAQTVRRLFIRIPCRLVTTGGQYTLKLADHYPFQKQWRQIRKRLEYAWRNFIPIRV